MMTNNDPLRPEETSSEGMVTRRLDDPTAGNAGATGQGAQGNWQDVGEDWRAVGEEFKKLGVRLGAAIQSGWKSGNDQELTTLQDQLRAMVDNVESAVRAAREEAVSPETKAQTQRVVEATKEAQAGLVDEVRDLVVAGLRTLNTQLRELADRLDNGRK